MIWDRKGAASPAGEAQWDASERPYPISPEGVFINPAPGHDFEEDPP